MNKNKFLILAVCILSIFKLTAEGFYDLNTIQTIKITFAQSNWDALLDAEKAGDENYIMATSLDINGVVYDSVGVKYKGNSTYKSNQVKNPFHIELDTYKEQDYEGYTDIKLSNVANDPSFLREVLSYQIIRQYMEAPLSNYANVYVNGTLIGLYSNSEAVSKKFVKSHFGSKTNTFVKCNPPDGADPNGSDYPNLVYLGVDSTDYYDAYELESDAGWKELINLCDTLKNNVASIESILDVNRALWMLALDNAIVNLDSYIGAFSQNYYLYRDDNKRFIPVIWDLNESFGRFSSTGSTELSTTSSKQKMDYLLHSSDADYPLIQKLLSIPRYKRMYLANYKTILLENFDNNTYYNTGLTLQNVIKDAVNNDKNKFFTYSNFISNLTTDVSASQPGPGSSGTVGITSLMNGRSSYLLALSDFTNTEPTISDITLSDDSPIINETITISASIQNATTAYLGFRTATNQIFTQLPMFDDGAHNDGAANDGIFGINLQIGNVINQYYIYAENDNAGMFSPRRAEFEYYTFNANYTSTTVGDLVINEVMASNSATVVDQNGEADDWIELYNNSASQINIEGYHLSDDLSDLSMWSFPTGTTIQPNGYLTIWADKDVDQVGLHTNFKLSATSERIFLSDAAGVALDEVSFENQLTDISYGRIPNGTGNFQTTSPSFGSENQLYTGINDIASTAGQLSIYPNPAIDNINLILPNNTESQYIEIFNTLGVLMKKITVTEQPISITDLPNGMYLVRLNNYPQQIVKFIKQ